MSTELLLRLQQIPGFGMLKLHRLLEKIDLDVLVNYDEKALYQLGWNQQQITSWFSPKTGLIEPILEWGEYAGNAIINFFDDSYPYLLKQISGHPLVLFVRGNVSTLSDVQLSIVGSRHCSTYGEYWAKYFATELSMIGITITSGLALGIDSFCHRAVVDVKGKTIAVLGSGLDNIYPKRHHYLAEEIIDMQGALVSEFYPKTAPVADNFSRRNRLISGLS